MGGDRQSYRRLFGAYVLASLGTGVAVVALSLLAFDLVRDEQQAAGIIGTALSIKMLAYVLGGPVEAAVLGALPRRPLLIGLDLVRAGAILTLPFVAEVWQLFALVALFTLASAAFTPAYQASVPVLLPDARDYAKALSKSRLAAELEGLASPLLAAALLAVLSVRGVFVAAMAAFLISALLLVRARLPDPEPADGAGSRLLAGFSALLRHPALRGLLPVAVAAGAATAVVMVETVPIVRGRFGLGAEEAALALAAFGAGSIGGALALPRLLERFSPRAIMLAGGALCAAALAGSVAVRLLPTLILLWTVLGAAATLAQAPALALIGRTGPEPERQALYAANLSMTTAVGGLCFAAAGAIGSLGTLADATAALAGVAALATAAAALLWRRAGESEDA